MNNEFLKFKTFVKKTTEIVSLDLDAMERIARSIDSNNETIQTTIRPCDEHLKISKTSYVSRCTIPIVMTCFAIIDLFGQWVSEYSDDDFAHSSSAFFRHLADKDDLKNEAVCQLLKKTFRHGVVHSFFAEQGFGITYPNLECNILFLSVNGPQQDTLNAKYLLSIVRLGMSTLNSMDESDPISVRAFSGYKRWNEKQRF